MTCWPVWIVIMTPCLSYFSHIIPVSCSLTMCCVQMCPATLNPVVIPRSASLSLNWNNPCRWAGQCGANLRPEPVSWWVQFNPLCDSDLSLASRWDHLNPSQSGHLVGYWGGRLIRLAGPRGLSDSVRLTVQVLLEGGRDTSLFFVHPTF